jgi:glutathione S-transferase
MTYLGEFWFQRGSPYSLQAYWSISHSRVHVKLVQCIPLVTTFFLWLRLGMKTLAAPLTLPIVFPARTAAPTARPIRDSSNIARVADALRANPDENPSLFPPRCIVEIDKFMRASATMAQYGRTLLLDAMLRDPRAAAEVVLPRFMRRWFFVPALLRFVRSRMLAKYPEAPTREDVCSALLSLRRALAKSDGPYICSNGFTYADICMCCCMYFAVERRPGSAAARVYGDSRLSKEFEDLVRWRADMFLRHYPGVSEQDAYKCLPPKASA